MDVKNNDMPVISNDMEFKPTRLLIISDNIERIQIVLEALQGVYFDYQLISHINDTHTPSMRDVDTILYDAEIKSNASAEIAIQRLRVLFEYTPIIALSLEVDNQAALRWITAGADECLFTSVIYNKMIYRVINFAIERSKTYAAVHKNKKRSTIINALLKVGLKDISLEEALTQSLRIILKDKFIRMLDKAAIFMFEDSLNNIQFSAQINMDNDDLALQSKNSQDFLSAYNHANSLPGASGVSNNDVEIWFLPITVDKQAQGVLILFIEESIQTIRQEMDFMQSIADTISGMFKRAIDKRALVAAHQQNSNILSSISSIMIGLNENHVITNWNEAAEHLLGLSKQYALGHDIKVLKIDCNWSQIHSEIHKAIKQNDQQIKFETQVKSSNGLVKLLAVTITPFVKGDFKQGMLIIADDITEQRNMQDQLQQAQKLQSIGQLAAGIAHEINTPIQYVGDNIRFFQDSFTDFQRLLQVIRNSLPDGSLSEWQKNINLMMEDIDIEYLEEEIPNAIEQSLHGIERVSEIVMAMKDFSHPGDEMKNDSDINAAINSTVTITRNIWKYSAEMQLDLAADLPMVPCLLGPFNEVILNMIVNATHAINDRIQDTDMEMGLITISTRQGADYVEIKVSDTGGGIPESIQARIFDPFFTTKEVGKGTGQGLAISHDIIVSRHQGELYFTTELDKGTTFVIKLPLN